jgi:tetratricopeptide (TPR) repeat protein
MKILKPSIRLFLCTAFYLAVMNCSYCQSLAQLITQAQQFENTLQEEKALDTYKKIITLEPKNALAYQRGSFVAGNIGERSTGEQKKQLYILSKQYAEKALVFAPKEAFTYYVGGVILGRYALEGSPKQKVAASRSLRSCADKAVALDPNSAYCLHLLGRYHLEVSRLSFIERTAANKFLGGLPSGDIQTAITYMSKAYGIDKNFIMNAYNLAQAYEATNQKEKAISIWKGIATTPQRFVGDAVLKQKAAKRVLALSK